MRPSMPWRRRLPIRASRWRNTIRFWKWRRTIPAFAQKFISAWALRPNSCLSTCPNSGHSYTHPGGIGAMVQAGTAASQARVTPYRAATFSEQGLPLRHYPLGGRRNG